MAEAACQLAATSNQGFRRLVSVFEGVEFATRYRVDWFNTRRLLEPIGDVPPAENEARDYAQLCQPAAIDNAIASACIDRRSFAPGASYEVELPPIDAEFSVLA